MCLVRRWRAGRSSVKGWVDKIECDAPVFADVKACLRTKGYVDLASNSRQGVQHAAE
jgi:hypothetical protein